MTSTAGSIGRSIDSTGTVTVTGAGSTWDMIAALRVGEFGTGSLTVADGGSVSNLAGRISSGRHSIGTVTVTGPGSTWNMDLLVVGEVGTGSLTVADGGTVSNTNGRIAERIDTGPSGFVSSGTVTVTGAGSSWINTGGLYVGGKSTSAGGNGDLNILDGGHVEVAGQLKIWNTGSVIINGGTLSVGSTGTASITNLDFQAGNFNLTNANLVVGVSGLFGDELIINGQQTVNVTNLTTIESGADLIVLPGGAFSSGGLTNNGTAVFIDTTIGGPINNPAGSNIDVVGNVTFTGLVSGGGGIFGSGTADFQGGFSPGDSPAIVSIEGSANLADTNTLFIEIGGTTPGTDYDVLDIAGNADLGGLLRIEVSSELSLGDRFGVLNASSVTGVFDSVTWTGLTLAERLSVEYRADGVDLVVRLNGDFDFDGDIDNADIGLVAGNFTGSGATGMTYAQGDIDGDGDVDNADLGLVAGAFTGSRADSTAISASDLTIGISVPEPSSLALLGLGGLLLTRRRR